MCTCTQGASQQKQKGRSRIPAIGLAYAGMMHQANHQLSLVQRMNTLILCHGHAAKAVMFQTNMNIFYQMFKHFNQPISFYNFLDKHKELTVNTCHMSSLFSHSNLTTVCNANKPMFYLSSSQHVSNLHLQKYFVLNYSTLFKDCHFFKTYIYVWKKCFSIAIKCFFIELKLNCINISSY